MDVVFTVGREIVAVQNISLNDWLRLKDILDDQRDLLHIETTSPNVCSTIDPIELCTSTANDHEPVVIKTLEEP